MSFPIDKRRRRAVAKKPAILDSTGLNGPSPAMMQTMSDAGGKHGMDMSSFSMDSDYDESPTVRMSFRKRKGKGKKA